jgi:hypothetical protein
LHLRKVMIINLSIKFGSYDWWRQSDRNKRARFGGRFFG